MHVMWNLTVGLLLIANRHHCIHTMAGEVHGTVEQTVGSSFYSPFHTPSRDSRQNQSHLKSYLQFHGHCTTPAAHSQSQHGPWPLVVCFFPHHHHQGVPPLTWLAWASQFVHRDAILKNKVSTLIGKRGSRCRVVLSRDNSDVLTLPCWLGFQHAVVTDWIGNDRHARRPSLSMRMRNNISWISDRMVMGRQS